MPEQLIYSVQQQLIKLTDIKFSKKYIRNYWQPVRVVRINIICDVGQLCVFFFGGWGELAALRADYPMK